MMTAMNDDTATLLFESIATGRLVTFCGAGLSMAAPTSAPSAATVAETCSERYLSLTGTPLGPELRGDVEAMFNWFCDNNRFGMFIEKLVPWEQFQRPNHDPNAGHLAIADLLACKGLRACVTTNYDLFVEESARRLGEPDFQAIADTEDLSRGADHAPYLKVHGCGYSARSRLRTIWCKDQLDHTDLQERTTRFKTWLSDRLLNKDILIVGFWSDWSYLTDIFADCLAAISPSSVIVVDLSSPDELEQKAPVLWAWAHGDGIRFIHERTSGADFLAELAKRWGSAFVARLVLDASATYRSIFECDPLSLATPNSYAVTDHLYQLRRDLTGTLRHRPVRDKDPQDSRRLLVALHVRLLDCGATYADHSYELGAERIRLVSGNAELLSAVKQRYFEEPPSPIGLDKTVCVGAIKDPTPTNVVRGESTSTIVRKGFDSIWCTQEEFLESLRSEYAPLAS